MKFEDSIIKKRIHEKEPNEYTKISQLYIHGSYKNIHINCDLNLVRFGNFYKRFLQLSLLWLNNIDTKRYIESKLKKSYLENLLSQLERMCIRTLIQEIGIFKDTLLGNNSVEKYNYYINNYLQDDNYIKEITEIYPILLQSILERIVDYTRFILYVLEQYDMDKKELQDIILKGNIESFNTENSDLHFGAKSVVLFKLDNGKKLIFKPKSTGLKLVFNNILNEIYKYYNLNLLKYKLVEKNLYCWEEYIEYKCCKTNLEVDVFYYKLGIILCISRVLEIGDLHYENLIAHGEDPIFVDIEVCGFNDKEKMLSILQTGILPIGKIDFSAILGRENQETDFKNLQIVNDKTSDIKLSYKKVITKKYCNWPLDTEINADSIRIKQFLNGFIDAYIFCMNNKKFIQKLLPEKIWTRKLIRNTQEYAMLIRFLYSPDLLENSEKRSEYLWDYLSGLKDKENLLKSKEYECLIKGYVPSYYSDWSDDSLYANDQFIYNYFDSTILSNIQKNLNDLNYKDLNYQVKIINLCMYNPQKNYLLRVPADSLIKSQEQKTLQYISEGIITIAESLINDVVTNGDQFGWMTLSPNSKYVRNNVIMTDMYLYNGISGIAIFFAALLKHNSQEKYVDFFHLKWLIISKKP